MVLYFFDFVILVLLFLIMVINDFQIFYLDLVRVYLNFCGFVKIERVVQSIIELVIDVFWLMIIGLLIEEIYFVRVIVGNLEEFVMVF